MPGAMGAHATFGAKLISIFHENFARGMQSHQGLVILFDPETGAPVCAVDAGEITAIRTAAASAVATDALARKEAARLALLGYGEQAKTHARAIRSSRPLNPSLFGGGLPTTPTPSRSGCKWSSLCRYPQPEASERPLLGRHNLYRYLGKRADLERESGCEPGTHLNLVGSATQARRKWTTISSPIALHCRQSRRRSDTRVRSFSVPSGRLIGDEHIIAEIGQVLAGEIQGRRSAEDITIYKSLGHVVQDLATAWALYSDPE